MLRAFLAVSIGCLVVACSSSDTKTSTSSSSSSSSSGNSTCSCSGQVNGQSFYVACGSSQCVAGSTFSCQTGATLVQGERCGDDGGVASGEGCGLFTCRSTSDCGGIAPCFSASDGNNYCYEQEGNASECSSGTTATTKTTSNGPTTICVPANCPSPDAYVQ